VTDRQTDKTIILIPVSFDAGVETFEFGDKVWFELDVVALQKVFPSNDVGLLHVLFL
jgi:hypothetical protein